MKNLIINTYNIIITIILLLLFIIGMVLVFTLNLGTTTTEFVLILFSKIIGLFIMVLTYNALIKRRIIQKLSAL